MASGSRKTTTRKSRGRPTPDSHGYLGSASSESTGQTPVPELQAAVPEGLDVLPAVRSVWRPEANQVKELV